MQIRKGDDVLIMADIQVYQDVWWKRWLGIEKVERQRRVVRVDECVMLGQWPYVSFDYEANGRWIVGMYVYKLRDLMREACPFALGEEFPLDHVTV